MAGRSGKTIWPTKLVELTKEERQAGAKELQTDYENTPIENWLGWGQCTKYRRKDKKQYLAYPVEFPVSVGSLIYWINHHWPYDHPTECFVAWNITIVASQWGDPKVSGWSYYQWLPATIDNMSAALTMCARECPLAADMVLQHVLCPLLSHGRILAYRLDDPTSKLIKETEEVWKRAELLPKKREVTMKGINRVVDLTALKCMRASPKYV